MLDGAKSRDEYEKKKRTVSEEYTAVLRQGNKDPSDAFSYDIRASV